MIPSVHDAFRYVRAPCRIRVQWQSRALLTILLIAPLALAAASGANAQTITIGPNTTLAPPQLHGPPFYVPGGPMTNSLSPGQTANVVGPVTITGGTGIGGSLGDVFRAPTTNITNPAILNIGGSTSTGPITITTGPTTLGIPPTADSALVVNGGGLGAPNNVNSTNTGINVNVTGTPGAPVALSSSGHGVIWLWGPNATLTAMGMTVPSTTVPGDVVFTGSGTPTNFAGGEGAVAGLRAQEATVVTVQNGATADLTNVTLDLVGPAGFLPASKIALCAGGCGETGDPGTNTGGNFDLNNVVINVSSDNSAGMWVSRLGTMQAMVGGSITTTGANSTGVHADLSGAPTLTDVDITMTGINSLGAQAATFVTGDVNPRQNFSTGSVTINGGSITMEGDNSTAVKASGSYAFAGGSTATVTLNGTTILTMGAGSTGLAVCACDGVSVNTDAIVFGTQPPLVGGTIIATNTNITTTGPNSIGVFAQDGSAPAGVPNSSGLVAPAVPPGTGGPAGSITLNGGAVTIEAAGGADYFANNGTISANNITAETMGATSPGGMLSNGGALTINGGSVTTTGAGSFGFLVQPAMFVPSNRPGTLGVSTTNAGATNALTISGATVSSAADAFHVTDAAADISVNTSTITGENGVLLNTVSSGLTNLTDTGSTLTGAILTDASSTARVTLNSDTWNMTGSSNMTSLAETGSTINFTAPANGGGDVLANYKTLTTNTFLGSGGEINMNTFLGADGSASDRIVITGTASADPVSLFFTNRGGPGALTQANGILVVEADEVGGTTQPGMFVMDNPELRAGAWDYRLFRGSPNDSDPAVANDWFLRSTFVAPPTEPPPPTGPLAPPPVELVPPPIPGEPPVQELPSTPPPTPLPPDVLFPIIGPELATYGVVQPLARQLGLSILGTLDDRVGDTYEPDVVAPAVPAPEGPAVELPTKKPAVLPTKKPGPVLAPRPLFAPSVWGRFFGQTIDNRYGAFADPHASGNLGGFQGGIDLLRGSLIAGQFERMGLYGAYGNVNANVDGLVTNAAATGYVNTHTGSMSLNAWSGGAYWTHVGPGGWYLDTVLQGTSYSGSASTQDARLNTDGWGFIASLEGGVPFALPQLGPGFVLEPQGQILWQKVSFAHDYDGFGDVALGDTTGPSGRIGLRGKWTIVTAGDQVWQPYVRANLWRDWGAEANTVYSGTDVVPLLSQATLLELGGGVTGRINANVSVFANVDYQFAVGAGENEKRNGVRGALGARHTW
jgi:outer membrane autotransporter protein